MEERGSGPGGTSPLLLILAALLLAGAGLLIWWKSSFRGNPGAPINASVAIAVFRDLASCQEQFRDSRAVDLDGDGRGEFGFLDELTGAAGPRTTADGFRRGALPVRPLLSPAMTPRPGNVPVAKSGYLYRVFLPGSPGEASAEMGAGLAFSLPVDTDLAEERWCAYAWPATDVSGNGVFYVDETGEVWQTLGGKVRFVGGAAPAWDAALPGGSPRSWRVRRSADGPAADGNLWTRVR